MLPHQDTPPSDTILIDFYRKENDNLKKTIEELEKKQAENQSMTISLQQYVKFRLSKRGEEILEKYYNDMRRNLQTRHILESPRPDEQRFYTMRLQTAIHIFGSNQYPGASNCFLDDSITFI